MWRTVKRQLGDLASDVRFIMVTVDPDADRPAPMKRYVQLFDPSFIGLSGSVDELARAWGAFNVNPKRLELPASATQHSISHPASVYVVDRDGRLRLEMPFGERADEAAMDIQRLMGRAS
jgi:protein SCO1/2